MFIEVFKLKKDSWHAKMIKTMWNLNYNDFSHMCPYFWLGVFSVIIFPLYYILRPIVRGIEWIVDKIEMWNENQKEKYYQKLIKKYRDNPAQIDYLLKMKMSKFDELTYRLRCIGIDTNDLVVERNRSIVNKIRIENELRDLKEVSNKIRINNILRIVKPISVGIIWIGTAMGLYIVGLILIYLAAHFSLTAIYGGLKIAGIVIGTILCVVSIGITMYYIIQKSEASTQTFDVLKPFKWFFGGIKFIFTIIGQMIKNHCPAIDWE